MRKTYYYRGWVIQWSNGLWGASKGGSRWLFGDTLERTKQRIDELELLGRLARQLFPNAIREKNS